MISGGTIEGTYGNMVKNRGLTQVIRKRGKYENFRADKIHRRG